MQGIPVECYYKFIKANELRTEEVQSNEFNQKLNSLPENSSKKNGFVSESPKEIRTRMPQSPPQEFDKKLLYRK